MPPVKDRNQPAVTTLLIGCILVLLVIIAVLLVRMGPPGPPPGPPGPERGPATPEMLKTVTGKVNGFADNVHLDINRLQIEKAGQGMLTFEFRPHTASAVTGVAQAGDNVEIAYDTQPNDEAIVYRLHRITNLNTGQVVDVDQLPPPPRIPPGQRAEVFNISNPEVITDGYGGIAALKVPGRLFHFKPEQVEDIQALIKNARQCTLLAVNRSDDQGFVNSDRDKVYIVISITINNKTFTIR
ncbi:hypothetical protein [Siphonobacter aquaeclarae]|uniref:Uncharacterized protein n=1 Tax=Siphonobacter aquaeclarae TaxID=563176 RepID=A0A1G9JRX2_9BACT|nr:hypothetical protein [Siphonobacter aquaeclarae]SDL40181.1 hypothetical protein SAMN04488090_0730 [Siphonobacter aquaeclarae]